MRDAPTKPQRRVRDTITKPQRSEKTRSVTHQPQRSDKRQLTYEWCVKAALFCVTFIDGNSF
ncbi:MAG: hypothetical protein KME29_32045 [Calothrix sp. FI2-JRJ7]|nr:hypothetical protein [Calothrix sp. FI2-JRJ7]